MAKKPATAPDATLSSVNTDFLQSLLGYNARRAALVIIDEFLNRMKPLGLRPVEFSVLCVIAHNPGVTSRQLCAVLGLQPPNLVAPLQAFEARGLLERRDHPSDGRAWGLHLSAAGAKLVQEAEKIVLALERDAAPTLTEPERATLIRLLQKLYL